MMVLPRESIETALANNLNVLNMLRKSHIQLMLTTKEEELEMFNREWPAWENFQTRYDICLIIKEVCAVRFEEGA